MDSTAKITTYHCLVQYRNKHITKETFRFYPESTTWCAILWSEAGQYPLDNTSQTIPLDNYLRTIFPEQYPLELIPKDITSCPINWKNIIISSNFSDRSFTGEPLNHLASVPSSEVIKLLSSMSSKSSPMNFIPTSLLKSCPGPFFDIIAYLTNLSFSLDQFPSFFKLSQVTPLLKKAGLDKNQPSNYHPISNLNNISKIRAPLSCSYTTTCHHLI